MTASASTRRTISSASPTARSGSPTRRSASAATGKATRRRRNCRTRSIASRPTASSGSSPRMLAGPNGLAFSPDEKEALRRRIARAAEPRDLGLRRRRRRLTLSNKTKFIDANGPGALDGFKVDTDGNLWCGWGSNGSPAPSPRTSTASWSSTPQASRSASSACPSAAPIWPSAVRRRTGCSWRAAIRSTRLYVEAQGGGVNR